MNQEIPQFSIVRLGILFGVGILAFLAGISTINSIIIPLALEMLNEGIISEIKQKDAPLIFFMIIGILALLFFLPWGSYIIYYLVKKRRLGSRKHTS